jgi:threonine dehydrogenase-like Zn-dependent dehydrogenase
LRAVWLEDGSVSVRNVREPRPASGFALMRLICGGICNTDLELQRGYYGFRGVPGHEFVGEVVESVNTKLRGRRVVGEINIACGTCAWCRRGLRRHCPARAVLGIVRHPGAFAGLLTLPERNLHLVPPEVPTEQAVFTEPVAAACEILDQVRISRGQQVAVLGDGKLGLLIAQVLALRHARVHLYGRHRRKVRIAEKAGVDGRIVKRLPRSAYEITVDATGSPAGLRQAVSMTMPRGTVVMKSTVHGPVDLDSAPVIVNELTLVGSRCGRFEAALPLLKTKRLALREMISDEFPLDKAPLAFSRAAERGTLKVLLRG